MTNNTKRDLFEIENARNLTRDELVATFVPTKTFRRLLSPKNHIILGSRGSGKTALAKMMSHDHLSRLEDPLAKEIIQSQSFIGIYVPSNIEWVGGLKNKSWQNEEEMEHFFQWKLNLSSCLAFLITLRSCLNAYISDEGERARKEKLIVQEISKDWFENENSCNSISQLESALEDTEFKKQQQLAKIRALGKLSAGEAHVGYNFDVDLFALVRRGIKTASTVLNFNPETVWFMILDEAEFLTKEHHRILNTFLRSDSKNLSFKITTMPYCHYTLETNTLVPLNVDHDFEYVYIEQENIFRYQQDIKDKSKDYDFVNHIFSKRIRHADRGYKSLEIKTLFGYSNLLDFAKFDIQEGSRDLELFKKYTSPITLDRGLELLEKNPRAFRDQIGRKMRGLLLLKEALDSTAGNKKLDIYSGARLIVTCGDGNPRRLIRIFNKFLKSIDPLDLKGNFKSTMPIINPKDQSSIITSIATNILSRFKNEEKVGPDLHEFMLTIGGFMSDYLHKNLLTTEQISSIEIDKNISDKNWELVKKAVGLGLLYPNVNMNNPDQMPEKEGTFHLAFILAPYFKILPRRGDSRALSTILKNKRQLNLFNDTL